MRPLARRPLTLALSLLLLSVLGAYGLGLTHGHPARTATTPLGTARLLLHDLCAPHHTVCGQVVPGVLGATLLIGMARVRDGLSVTTTMGAHNAATPTATPQPTSAAPASPVTLLGLVALVLACCWLTVGTRITRLTVAPHALPRRSIPAHLCTPAP